VYTQVLPDYVSASGSPLPPLKRGVIFGIQRGIVLGVDRAESLIRVELFKVVLKYNYRYVNFN